MQKILFIGIIFFMPLIIAGCGSEQHVLWNISSEAGGEIKVKVREEYHVFNRKICILIDGNEVIKGNSGKDKKIEYNAEYKGKKIKSMMLYNSQTKDEIIEVFIDDKLVGEFLF
ncbi:MAG: hypothetical protein WCI84_07820 [Bacteroidota bacterium]